MWGKRVGNTVELVGSNIQLDVFGTAAGKGAKVKTELHLHLVLTAKNELMGLKELTIFLLKQPTN